MHVMRVTLGRGIMVLHNSKYARPRGADTVSKGRRGNDTKYVFVTTYVSMLEDQNFSNQTNRGSTCEIIHV